MTHPSFNKFALRFDGIFFPALLVVSLLGILLAAGYWVMAERHADYVTHINSVEGRLAISMRRSVYRRAVIVRDLALLTDPKSMNEELAEYTREQFAYRQSEQELARMFALAETTDRERRLLEKIREAEAVANPILKQTVALGLVNRNQDAAKAIFSELVPAQKRWVDLLNQLIELEESLNGHPGDDVF